MSESEANSYDYSYISIVGCDFFTLAHWGFGMILYLLFHELVHLGEGFSLLIILIIGILFEIIDNFLLNKLGFKWSGRQDSILNLISDIVFTIIGALYADYIDNNLNSWISIGFLFILFLVLYMIARKRCRYLPVDENQAIIIDIKKDSPIYAHVALVGVDFFSISHVATGMLLFTLLNLIPALDMWIAWYITIAIGVIWEPLENITLKGSKWGQRRDSALNITCDILFVAWGGLSSLFIDNLPKALIINTILYVIFGILNYIAKKEVEKPLTGKKKTHF